MPGIQKAQFLSPWLTAISLQEILSPSMCFFLWGCCFFFFCGVVVCFGNGYNIGDQMLCYWLKGGK